MPEYGQPTRCPLPIVPVWEALRLRGYATG